MKSIKCSLFQYIEVKKFLNSKQRTKLKTANSDGIYFRSFFQSENLKEIFGKCVISAFFSKLTGFY